MRSGKQAGRSVRLSGLAFLPLVCSLLAASLVTGCGNFWQAPSTTTGTGTGGCTTNCSTATSGSFYILNAGDTPQVVGESIVSGKLTSITGSPWDVSGTPYAMSVDPSGGFLIVSSTSGVFSYPITSGELGTPVVVSSDQAYGVQVDSTSSWLIEAIPGTGGVTIGAVPVDSATGVSAGSEQTVSFNITNAALQPNRLVISGDNKYIFVSLGAGGTLIVPFNANVATGSNPIGTKATTLPVVATSGSALSVAVDPGTTPRLFYVGETLASSGSTGGLRVFNYSSLGSSTLTQASGSPIASGGLAPNFILPATGGAYVYVANGKGTSTAGIIGGFSVTASASTAPDYTVAALGTVATGVQPLAMAEDASSTFVMEVGSLGSPYLDAYDFDSTTLGQLDSQIVSTTSSGSIAIVSVP